MIVGVITARDVLAHPALIVGAWGWAVYFSALLAVFSGRRTTFLALAWEVGRG